MSEKLLVTAPKNYYKDLPIQPGFMFLDTLLKAPRANITELKVNIPECLYSSDKLYFIKTRENGMVTCNTEINQYKFMKMIEAFKENSDALIDRVAVVLRVPY